MYIAWEGKAMGKTAAVLRYEYKMLFLHPAGWGVLAAATALTLLDNFPSAGNLARLEFLDEPAYFVYRIMNFDSLILLFGLMFLLAGRIPLDARTGMRPLFMASPLHKREYAAGKLLGGVFYVFTMQCLFLFLNTAVYCVAAPSAGAPAVCMIPLAKAVFACAAPVSLFVGVCAVALPGLIDLRLFYILAAALFGFNAAYTGSAKAMPFYLITSGDLVRLIWTHPQWPSVPAASVLANALFLVGSAAAAAYLLLAARKYWRPE